MIRHEQLFNPVVKPLWYLNLISDVGMYVFSATECGYNTWDSIEFHFSLLGYNTWDSIEFHLSLLGYKTWDSIELHLSLLGYNTWDSIELHLSKPSKDGYFLSNHLTVTFNDFVRVFATY